MDFERLDASLAELLEAITGEIDELVEARRRGGGGAGGGGRGRRGPPPLRQQPRRNQKAFFGKMFNRHGPRATVGMDYPVKCGKWWTRSRRGYGDQYGFEAPPVQTTLRRLRGSKAVHGMGDLGAAITNKEIRGAPKCPQDKPAQPARKRKPKAGGPKPGKPKAAKPKKPKRLKGGLGADFEKPWAGEKPWEKAGGERHPWLDEKDEHA